jgi:hypothetical protein
MDLPTDVLLRTTESLGSLMTDMHDQWSAWIAAIPDESAALFMSASTLDAADEFGAGPFNVIHGWYRPATTGLRNALDGMTIAAGLAVRDDTIGLSEWRAGREASSQTRWISCRPINDCGNRGSARWSGLVSTESARNPGRGARTPLPLRP